MGNNNSIKQNQKILDNKKEFKFILTRSYISDISIFHNYEIKYKSITNKDVKFNEINNNYIFIICGLMDGFIEIYKNIFNNEFKLSLSFKAHRELISKITQLKKSGYLLTCSFDNSFKVFKLSKNCTKETLLYTIYLNPIFNRINDVIQINNDEILLISVFNHIIYFPYNKNNISELKNNLNDYFYSKYEHRKKFLNNLLEINENIFLALDEVENKILFFKLISEQNIIKDMILIKSILTIFSEENNKGWDNQISIENLLPKYNFILISVNNYIKIIDIKYLEIIFIYEMKISSFFFSYNNYIDKIIILEGNNIFNYRINSGKDGLNFFEENKKYFEFNTINELNKIRKLIYNPLNINIIYIYYKKFLINIDLNFL